MRIKRCGHGPRLCQPPAPYPPVTPPCALTPCIYNVLPLDNVDNDKLFRPLQREFTRMQPWRNSLKINALALLGLDHWEILDLKAGASVGQDVNLDTV